MGSIEIPEENRGHDLGPRNPAPLFRSVSLPVNEVLETPTTATNFQELPYRPLGMAIHQLRRGRSWSWRYQITSDKGLNPGDVEHWVNSAEGVREDQPDRDGVNQPVDGVRANEPRSQFS